MIRRLIPLLLLGGAAAADGPPAQSLGVSASTPTVSIARREAGRGFVALPTIEFHFLVEPACAAGWQPRTVSLSVADTRLTLTPEPAAAAALEALLTVPATQLAPLPVAGFCEQSAASADDSAARVPAQHDADPAAATEADGPSELTIEAAASAQAALLCTSDEGERLTFVARPLAVTLVCGDLPGEPVREARSD